MDASDALSERNEATTTRDAALARLRAFRERGRARSPLARAILAGIGAVLFVGSIPLVVLLPELGVPILLIALRLLAVEVEWAHGCLCVDRLAFRSGARLAASPARGGPGGVGHRLSRGGSRYRVVGYLATALAGPPASGGRVTRHCHSA